MSIMEESKTAAWSMEKVSEDVVNQVMLEDAAMLPKGL